MRSKTVLDHVRPTVVVRRRIYDPAQFHDGGGGATALPAEAEAERASASASASASTRMAPGPEASHGTAEPRLFERAPTFLPTQSWGAVDEDESGPPSSVNVARALASLRGDELKRLEDLIAIDDDDDGPTSSVIAPPISFGPVSFGPASFGPASSGPASLGPTALGPAVPGYAASGGPASARSAAFARVEHAPLSRGPLSTAHVQPPTLRLPKQSTVGELARRMSVSPQDLVSALVTGGFFTVKGTSVLPRATARIAASLFGWGSDDMTDEEEADLAKTTTRSRGPVRKKKAAEPVRR